MTTAGPDSGERDEKSAHLGEERGLVADGRQLPAREGIRRRWEVVSPLAGLE